MIYEFLYESKPVGLHLIAIAIFWVVVFLSFSVYYYRLSRPPKEKYRTLTTCQYDADLQKEVVISQTVSENTINSYDRKFYIKRMTVSALFCIIFSAIFAFELYDKITTPNKNTKTTDLYKITKEKNYLTFTSKKPYNHLYKTKTMEITYANSGEYVIVTDHQAYRIPKESVSE
jgi:hypothetical protein